MKLLQKFAGLKNSHIFGILFILGLIAYTNVLNGDFIWDEVTLITKNEHTHSFTHFFNWFTKSSTSGAGLEDGNLYRPLSTMIYATVYTFFKTNVIAYHSVNLLIHITNAFLAFILLQKLNFARFGSFLAAVIFLLHPVQTESVSYIAGLPDVLSPLCILLGLVFFTRNLEGENIIKENVKIAGLLVLSILAKETGIIFVPLATLVLFYKKSDYSKSEVHSKIKTLLILTLLTVIYVVLRSTVLNFTGSLSLSFEDNVYSQNMLFRIYTFFVALIHYTKLVLYPVDLHFEKAFEIYSYISPKVFTGILLFLVGSICALISFYKKRQFLFIYMWFFISISLVSGIILPANSTYKEHWLYLPLVGFVLFIPITWEKLASDYSKKIFLSIFTIITILFTLQTINRNNEWKDILTFYENEIEHNQLSPRLFGQIAKYHFDQKEYEKAVEYYKKGIEVDTRKAFLVIREYLGHTYLRMKNLDAAINEYFGILELNPNYLGAHFSLRDIGRAMHNESMESAFQGFINRIENGGSVDFENEILPFTS